MSSELIDDGMVLASIETMATPLLVSPSSSCHYDAWSVACPRSAFSGNGWAQCRRGFRGSLARFRFRRCLRFRLSTVRGFGAFFVAAFAGLLTFAGFSLWGHGGADARGNRYRWTADQIVGRTSITMPFVPRIFSPTWISFAA